VGAVFYYAQGYPLSVGFGQGWAAYNLINQDNTSDIGGGIGLFLFLQNKGKQITQDTDEKPPDEEIIEPPPVNSPPLGPPPL
jgi:hypothetical protein